MWIRLLRSDALGQNGRFTHAPNIGNLGSISAGIILGLGVSRPRQVEEIFRTLSHYLYTDLDQTGMVDESTFMLILILFSLNTVTPSLFDQIADGNASVEQRLDCVLKITRSKIKELNWNTDYVEGRVIDAFVDRHSVEEFKSKFQQTLNEEELKYRKDRRSGMPHFSTAWPESQMQILANKLRSLKRFSGVVSLPLPVNSLICC